MKYKGNGKSAKKKGGDSVSMATVGNVKGGSFSDANDGLSMADYNRRTKKAGMVAGSHRKTHRVGKPRGHHRSG